MIVLNPIAFPLTVLAAFVLVREAGLAIARWWRGRT